MQTKILCWPQDTADKAVGVDSESSDGAHIVTSDHDGSDNGKNETEAIAELNLSDKGTSLIF